IAAQASLGPNNFNWFVYKVNGNGSAGWTYTFDGAAGGLDQSLALTRTTDGNVVAVGMTTTTPTSSFARAAKINASNGAEMNVYTSPTNFSKFNGVAADSSGNVYVTGSIFDTNGLTVKLNSSLSLIWSQTFDGAAGLADSFSQVAVDPSSGDC